VEPPQGDKEIEERIAATLAAFHNRELFEAFARQLKETTMQPVEFTIPREQLPWFQAMADKEGALLVDAKAPALIKFGVGEFARSFDVPKQVILRSAPILGEDHDFGVPPRPYLLCEGLVYEDVGATIMNIPELRPYQSLQRFKDVGGRMYEVWIPTNEKYSEFIGGLIPATLESDPVGLAAINQLLAAARQTIQKGREEKLTAGSTPPGSPITQQEQQILRETRAQVSQMMNAPVTEELQAHYDRVGKILHPIDVHVGEQIRSTVGNELSQKLHAFSLTEPRSQSASQAAFQTPAQQLLRCEAMGFRTSPNDEGPSKAVRPAVGPELSPVQQDVAEAIKMALEGTGKFQAEDITTLGEVVLEKMKGLFQARKEQQTRVSKHVTFVPYGSDVQEEEETDKENETGQRDLEMSDAYPTVQEPASAKEKWMKPPQRKQSWLPERRVPNQTPRPKPAANFEWGVIPDSPPHKYNTNRPDRPTGSHWAGGMDAPSKEDFEAEIRLENKRKYTTAVPPTFSRIQYQTPEDRWCRVPPTLQEALTNNPEVAAMLRTLGDPPKFKVNPDKNIRSYISEWFDTILQYAAIANMDPSHLILNRLPHDTVSWFLNLLRSNTYHHWSGAQFEALRSALKKRFGNQTRKDEDLAMDEWAKGFHFNPTSETVANYADRIDDCERRCGGRIPEAMKCRTFLMGLPLLLAARCRRTPTGKDWIDYPALVQFTEVAQEQAQLIKEAYSELDKQQHLKHYAAPLIPQEKQEKQERREHKDSKRPTRESHHLALGKKERLAPLPKAVAELVSQEVQRCPAFKWGVKGIHGNTIEYTSGCESLERPGQVIDDLARWGICFKCRGLGETKGRHPPNGTNKRCPLEVSRKRGAEQDDRAGGSRDRRDRYRGR
jgi:hypothetical protein